ncbi:hypothetical protein E1B28_013081 [Marasmius oreades]|uniref:Uncharacterized protein n=1 Tax=Marasmius oreades TaxID=181124 RepID=A0A9P7RPV6_9AGAR|nr:uncharacterized protein E1B28_013081 [Marasmius oreades]KAG7087100.1 hypothetical protein E1B28_013081 [Marasmius oreades]
MCGWYSREQIGIEIAYTSLKFQNSPGLRLQAHLDLVIQWANPFLSLLQLCGSISQLWLLTSGPSSCPTDPAALQVVQGVEDEEVDDGLDELVEDFHDIGIVDTTAVDHYLAEVLDEDAGEGNDDEEGHENEAENSGERKTTNNESAAHDKREESDDITFKWVVPCSVEPSR